VMERDDRIASKTRRKAARRNGYRIRAWAFVLEFLNVNLKKAAIVT
jgi:hypothetical protein